MDSYIDRAHREGLTQLQYPIKFWWDVLRSLIGLTVLDNTLMLDCAVLVASMLVDYEIDWVNLNS